MIALVRLTGAPLAVLLLLLRGPLDPLFFATFIAVAAATGLSRILYRGRPEPRLLKGKRPR